MNNREKYGSENYSSLSWQCERKDATTSMHVCHSQTFCHLPKGIPIIEILKVGYKDYEKWTGGFAL